MGQRWSGTRQVRVTLCIAQNIPRTVDTFAAQNGFLLVLETESWDVLSENTLSHSQPRDLVGIGASPTFRDGSLLALVEETLVASSGQRSVRMGDTELCRSFDSITGESRPSRQPPEDKTNTGL